MLARDYRVTFKSPPRCVCVPASQYLIGLVVNSSTGACRSEVGAFPSGTAKLQKAARAGAAAPGDRRTATRSPPRRDSVRRMRNPLRFAEEKATVLDRAKNTHVSPARPPFPGTHHVCLPEEARRGCRAALRSALPAVPSSANRAIRAERSASSNPLDVASLSDTRA